MRTSGPKRVKKICRPLPARSESAADQLEIPTKLSE
jgi:hypothetical protein